MVDVLVNAPRWLLLVTLVYAPWAYGGTRPWTIEVLNVLLALIVILWLAGCAVRRAWPVIARVPLAAAALLVAQAWWMVLNARSEYDTAAFQYLPLSPFLPWAPGSLHKSLSLAMAVRVSALLGAGCFCCDLARRPVWRTRLLWTMAGTGVSLVVFGLIERVAGAPGIFWGPPAPGGAFFATYRYHANAGSFINLVWPLVAGFLVCALQRQASRGQRLFWSAALVVCLAGVFVNASRAANIIALVLICVWLAWLLWKRPHRPGRPVINPAVLVATMLALVIVLAGVAALGGLDTTVRRWSKFNQEWSTRNPRLLVAEVCMRMLPEAGCWGFGPGTFKTVFPYYTAELGNEISGVWFYAHDDYLQTLLEWGWLGGSLWAVYVFGGVLFSFRTIRKAGGQVDTSREFGLFPLWMALLSVLIHAGMDFPLQVASIQLYVVVLVGLLWSYRRSERSDRNRPLYREQEPASLFAFSSASSWQVTRNE